MILATENFTLKIINSRAIENIFPEKISHDSLKFNHFLKIGKKRL